MICIAGDCYEDGEHKFAGFVRMGIYMDKHRIYNENIDIKADNTINFYNKRAERIKDMENPYMAVLLGDSNPERAKVWNEFEKSFILPKLKIDKNSDVLDVGCGMGRWAETIIPVCKSYTGIDFSDKMIDIAKQRCCFQNKDYHFENISFMDFIRKEVKSHKKFNRVLISGVCMYINDRELSEAFKDIDLLLDKMAVIYMEETVGIRERLTLKEFPSEVLKDTYNVIYRTKEEYALEYSTLIESGFAIMEQEFFPALVENEKHMETDRWYAILERN